MKTTTSARRTPTFPLTHLPTCLLALALIALPAKAADDLSTTLQRGLFEEEANHDLPAAIKAYESVVTATDAQRKLAGTALFRLAECYRKLGRTNDAVSNYQRVLREYPDQLKLVDLSRQYLVATAPAELGNTLEPERVRLLEHELELQRSEFSRLAEMHRTLTNLSRVELRKAISTVSPDPLLNTLQEQRVKAEQRLVELSHSYSADHPEVKSAKALLATIELQIDDQINGIIAGLSVRVEANKASLDRLAKALDEARAGASAPARSGAALPRAAMSVRQRDLILEDIKLLEQQLAAAKQKVKNGMLPVSETIVYERSLLHAQRELATLEKGFSSPEHRNLLLKEISFQEQALATIKKKIETGLAGIGSELAEQRDLIALKRELAALDESSAGASPPAAAPGVSQAPTDEEDKEVRRIQALIKDSPDLINAGDQSGSTPLHRAAAKGQLVVAQFLLANKANVNARRSENMTPLHDAVVGGHKSMTELLLKSGAEVNAAGTGRYTPLHYAARNGYKAIAEVLLANKANPNATDDVGGTPLHAATEKGFKSVVETLLANGADVNALKQGRDFANPADYNWSYRGSYGTALHMAVDAGNQPMTELLLAHHADLGPVNPFGETPLHLAAAGNNIALAGLLLAARADVNARGSKPGNDMGKTPLCYAATRGHAEMVEFLLKNGADPNVRFGADPNNTATPLLAALLANTLTDRERIVAALLEFKANPNVKEVRGYSPLHISLFSVFGGSTNLPYLLLKHGAEVDVRDAIGDTPLAWASTGTQVKELLLEYKANPNTQNNDGNTPLHKLVERTLDRSPSSQKDLAELLIARGADLNLRNRQGLTPLNLYGVPARTHNPHSTELAEVLRKHGAKDEQLDLEPDPDSIRVWRKGMTYGRVVFVRDAAGHNRFTLMEAILNFYTLRYTPPTLAPRPAAQSNAQPRPIPQAAFPAPLPPGQPQPLGLGQPQPNPFALAGGVPTFGFGGVAMANYDPLSEIPFPDLTRIRILRLVDAAKNEKKVIAVNLINAAGIVLCGNDVLLEFGDIIEIPEREYRLDEGRVGLAGDQNKQFLECLRRNVQFVVKGEPTEVKLIPVTTMAYLASAMKQSPVRNVLRSSSDLSRLRIRRRADAAIGQPAGDLTMDLEAFQRSGKLQWEDLWLRDGDMIEVPEREQ